jgi:hypothetical protein
MAHLPDHMANSTGKIGGGLRPRPEKKSTEEDQKTGLGELAMLSWVIFGVSK